MKNQMLMKTVLIACVLILAAAVILAAGQVFGFASYRYAGEEKYTPGNASIREPVRNLDIHWINGKVRIEFHSGETILLSETSDRDIPEDLRLRWWLDGDTLRVQYAKPAFRMSWTQKKELTLTLPEGITLNDVRIDATSSVLELPALRAETLSLATTSGDILAAAEASVIRCTSTSGRIALQSLADAREIQAEATSGSVQIDAARADRLKVSLTSGDIAIRAAQTGTLDASSTSGRIDADIGELGTGRIHTTSGGIAVKAAALTSLDLDSTSGGVHASLPAEPGLTVRADTTSGRFEHNLPLTRTGDQYVCGDGHAAVRLNTTSGNILLDPVR